MLLLLLLLLCVIVQRGRFSPQTDATDQLEQKVIEFFVNAKKNKPEWREEQMEVIKKVRKCLLTGFWPLLLAAAEETHEKWVIVPETCSCLGALDEAVVSFVWVKH